MDGYRRAMMEESKDPETIRKRAMANPEVQKIFAKAGREKRANLLETESMYLYLNGQNYTS